MYYLDANVFIYPALYDGEKSKGARELLRSIVEGHADGGTSALTIDEVVYILSREVDQSIAIEQGRRIIEFPNLRIFDIGAVTMLQALDAMDSHESLSPRDAIHFAAMRSRGIDTIVSDDHAFEEIPAIERRSLEP